MLPPFTNTFFPSIINKKLRASSDSFYPLLWNYFTIPAPVNILISTAINSAFQLGAAALYSTALLQLIMLFHRHCLSDTDWSYHRLSVLQKASKSKNGRSIESFEAAVLKKRDLV
ncbi:hypothetical protein ABE091_17075 [Bacillus pumilus]|uniref:hypothetical protein n=1 Tax=Bacillus pumilus TaxID=1408 RepID=UPI003D1C084D